MIEITLTETKHKKIEALVHETYVTIIATDKELKEMGDETAIHSITLEKNELLMIVNQMEINDPEINDPEMDESMDGDHASALSSCGWGTDEDYSMGEML